MKFQVDRVSFSTIWSNTGLLWIFSCGWIGLISGLAFIWQLGNTGLVDETEPLFAEAARQMTITGDWITPYFNGETRFDKPPLIYWLMAIAYQTLGVNEWAVRLPSALSAIALTLFGFLTLKNFGFPDSAETPQPAAIASVQTTWWTAWIGAAMIALNPHTLAWSRVGVSDMLLSSCMGMALLAFFWAYCSSTPIAKTCWYLVFYSLIALAVLTKGPVGVVLPFLIITAFILYLGKPKTLLQEMHLLPGGLLFLLITLPWYILVTLAHGEDYINSFFGYHNFERFTQVVNNHGAPWYFYFPVIFAGFAPWSIYLPAAIARLRFWRCSNWQQRPRTEHLGLFAAIWFGVIFGFFTIASTKLPSYVLPLMPAAAILVALAWSEAITYQHSTLAMQISHVISIIFAVGVAIAVLYSPNWLGNDPATPNLDTLVRQSGLTMIGGAIWLGVALCSLLLLLKHQGHRLWLISLLGLAAFIIFTIMPANLLIDQQRQLPLRQLATIIQQIQQPNEAIVMVGMRKPSLVFYTQKPITYITKPEKATAHLRRRARKSPNPITFLVIGRTNKIAEMELSPNRSNTLAKAEPYQLMRVRFR
jgi:4-amino-4-deoxy-L-arabinose transferase-like glycosyltransferase